LRCIRFLIAPHRTSQRDSTTPRRYPAGVLQTVFLGRVRGKQSVNALFQTVTGLQDRAYQGWRDVHKNSEGIRSKCKAGCGADGWPVSDNATTQESAQICDNNHARWEPPWGHM